MYRRRRRQRVENLASRTQRSRRARRDADRGGSRAPCHTQSVRIGRTRAPDVLVEPAHDLRVQWLPSARCDSKLTNDRFDDSGAGGDHHPVRSRGTGEIRHAKFFDQRHRAVHGERPIEQRRLMADQQRPDHGVVEPVGPPGVMDCPHILTSASGYPPITRRPPAGGDCPQPPDR